MSNSTTLLDTIATNQSNKEVVVNALLDAASPSMIWARHASACSGLTWGYYGGTYAVGSTLNAIANGTVALTASTTNYVYADATTGAVSVNTTGFPAGQIPLYSIVTGTTTVTSYTDERSYRPSAIATTGTVTSVGLSAPTQFSVGGSPVTGGGTLALSWANQTANYVLAGPTSGAAAAPTFRQLVGADIPVFGASGASHSQGGVPDPGATAGTTRYLREDGSWQVPPGSGGSSTLAGLSDVSVTEGSAIDGYSLTWHNATSKWVATNVSGGSGGSTPAVRGSNIQSSSAASYTVSWPTGTVAGDLVIIFVTGGYASALPSGWLKLDSSVAPTNVSGATYAKVMSSADITAGSVTISMGGTYNTVLACVSMVGSSMGLRQKITEISNAGRTSVAESTDWTPQTTDYVLYFGGTRGTGLPTCDHGTTLQSVNASNASGILTGGSPSATGGLSATFTYPSGNSGDYECILVMKSSA